MQLQIGGAELRAAAAKLSYGIHDQSPSSPESYAGQDPAFVELYAKALRLQEAAQSESPALQFASLTEACSAYQQASELANHIHMPTLYNHGVALSDLARLEPPGSEAAAGLLHQAVTKYTAALALDPLNPQALNNSGLVLQESAGFASPEDAPALWLAAATRFRAALRARPAFHQALYNLGTTLYSLASASRASAGVNPAALLGGWATSAESAGAAATVRAAFARAAIPIALACAALDVSTSPHQHRVYARSVHVVARLMPLPSLARARGAYCVTDRRGASGLRDERSVDMYEERRIDDKDDDGLGAITENWHSAVLELDAESIRSVSQPSDAGIRPYFRSLVSIAGAAPAADTALPRQANGLPWHALWISLQSNARGEFLLFDDEQDAACWVDAITTLCALRDMRKGGLAALEDLLQGRDLGLLENNSGAAVS